MSAVDLIPSDNTATATAVIEGVANMAITKNDDADPGNHGESIMYRIGVTNNGRGNASEITLTDPLPEGASPISAFVGQGNCIGTTTDVCS